MLTHGNLDHQIRAGCVDMNVTADSTFVHWLPQYHDFGLICCSIGGALVGLHVVQMSPLTFIAKPNVWLTAVSKYRGTHIFGPDFGYAYALRKTTPAERALLDLSCIHVAGSSAEPIRENTVSEFCAAFSASLRSDAFTPIYGSAEHFGVSMKRTGTLPRVFRVDAARLEVEGIAVQLSDDKDDDHDMFFDAEAEPPSLSLASGSGSSSGSSTCMSTTSPNGLDPRPSHRSKALVSCGQPLPGVEIIIVDPETRQIVPEGSVGEIWTAGPGVGIGYFGREEATVSTFGAKTACGFKGLFASDGRWLRTGDLGVLLTPTRGSGPELVITGRRKDVIIIAGRNYYPQDVEAAAETAAGAVLRPGCSAAVEIERGGRARMAYIAECRTEKISVKDLRDAADAARSGAFEGAGIAPDEVVLITPRSLPKTTSGKVRRSGVKQALATKTLKVLYRNTWDAEVDPAADIQEKPVEVVDVVAQANAPKSVIALASQMDRRQFFDSAGESSGSKDGSCADSANVEDCAVSRNHFREDPSRIVSCVEDDEGFDDWARMQEEPEVEEYFEAVDDDLGDRFEVCSSVPSNPQLAQPQPLVMPLSLPPNLQLIDGVLSIKEVTALVMEEVSAAMAKKPSESGMTHSPSTDTSDEDGDFTLTPATVNPQDHISRCGISSQQVVGIASRLGERLDLELPVTAVYDYPTLELLAQYVHNKLMRKAKGEDEDEDGDFLEGRENDATLGEEDDEAELRYRHLLDEERRASEQKNTAVTKTAAFTANASSATRAHKAAAAVKAKEIERKQNTEAEEVKEIAGFQAGGAAPFNLVTALEGAKSTSRHSIRGRVVGHAARSSAGEIAAPRRDSVGHAPLSRWDHAGSVNAGCDFPVPPFVSLMADTELFDDQVFGISSTEALYMDPQQRLVLDGILEARAPAGMETSDLASVYVGVGACEYHDFVLEPHVASSHVLVATGNELSVTAGRVSFIFNLRGPAVSVDTACSSSLVGTHLAARGIAAGDSKSAFACGVHAIFGPRGMMHFFGAGMLSTEGRCKTLDARADGYVRGEARGVMAMTAMGVTDTDNATGASSGTVIVVLDGTAVNQDGRSSSLTAPNGPAQQAVMRSAVADAFQLLGGKPLESMQCHGTGTSLGDPIEIGAIHAVHGCGRRSNYVGRRKGGGAKDQTQASDTPPLVLQAMKSYIGHCETAAGIMGLLEPVVRISHASSAQVLHLTSLNPHICTVMRASARRGAYRKAFSMFQHPRQNSGLASVSGGGSACGVGAFAFQGTNAHAIVVVRNVKSAIPATTLISGSNRRLLERKHHWPVPTFGSLWRISFTNHDQTMTVFHARPSRVQHSSIYDHQIAGRILFPAASFLEAAHAAVIALLRDGNSRRGDTALVSSTFARPLLLQHPEDSSAELFEINISASVGGNLEISTVTPSNGADTVHMHTKVAKTKVALNSGAGFSGRVTVDEKSDISGPFGKSSGASCEGSTALTERRTLTGVIGGKDSSSYNGYIIHPAILDATFHLVKESFSSSRPRDKETLRIPASLTGFAIAVLTRTPVRVASSCRCLGSDVNSPIVGDFVLQGSASVIGLTLRHVGGAASVATVANDGASDRHRAEAGASVPSRVMYHLKSLAVASPSWKPTRTASSETTAHARPFMNSLQRRTVETCASLISLMQCAVASTHASARETRVELGTNAGSVGGGDAASHHPVAQGVALSCSHEVPRSTVISTMDDSGTGWAEKRRLVAVRDNEDIRKDAGTVIPTTETSIRSVLGLPHAPVYGRAGIQCRAWVSRSFTCSEKAAITVAPATVTAQDAATLITGGLGALGLSMTRWMTASTPAGSFHTMHLLGRSGRSRMFPVEAWREACISGARCDVSSIDEVGSIAVTHLARSAIHPVIGTAIHAAGSLRDASLGAQTTGAVRDVLGSKVGSMSRMEASGVSTAGGHPLGFVVLCSSIAALMGSAGQTAYSGGNAVLDTRAKRLMTMGARGTSIQWGAWGGVGGMLDQGGSKVAARISSLGLGILAPHDGLRALNALLDNQFTVSFARPLIVVTVSPLNFRLIGRAVRPLPEILSDIPEALAGPEEAMALAKKTQESSMNSGSTSDDQRCHHDGRSLNSVLTTIRSILQGLVGNDELRDDEPLMDAGLDSLTSLELKNCIEGEFGMTLAPTAAFDFPTIAALASHVHREISACSGDDKSDITEKGMVTGVPGMSSLETATPHRSNISSVGVLSHSCKSAKSRGADFTATDGVVCVTSSRFNIDHLTDAHAQGVDADAVRFGAYIADVDRFDGACFKVRPDEALLIDPQQRSLLEGVLEAKLGATSPPCAQMSVYVGVGASEYLGYVLQASYHECNPYMITGNHSSVVSGRVSFLFGLAGAATSIDTACSASLVSAHLGFGDVSKGVTVGSFSCGVNVILDYRVGGLLSSAGMLSLDGRCKALDAKADGYVRGEARAVIMLGALERFVGSHAGEGGDGSFSASIAAVYLNGTAVNQDGQSSSLTAPNGPAQQAVMRMAIAECGQSGLNRGCGAFATVSMHGTGTSLGDPIEAAAIADVYVKRHAKESFQHQPLVLEASKSYVGHTELTAGIMGLLQPLIGITKARSDKIMHLSTLNPYVNRIASARVGSIITARQTQACVHDVGFVSTSTECTSRMRTCQSAGVSGFAFQGTNAHAVLTVDHAVLTCVAISSMTAIERVRYWPLPHMHPLVMRTLRCDASVGVCTLQMLLDPRQISHMWDSCVMGEYIFSTSSLIEAGFAAATIWMHDGGKHNAGSLGRRIEAMGLARCTMQAPLVLPRHVTRDGTVENVQITLRPQSAIELESLEHTTTTSGIDSQSRRRNMWASAAAIRAGVSSLAPTLKTARAIDADRLLQIFDGSSHRIKFATGVVCRSAGDRPECTSEEYHTHPVALDCSLQLSAAAGVGNKAPVRPPVVGAVEGYFGSHHGEVGQSHMARASASYAGNVGDAMGRHTLIGQAQLAGVTTRSTAADAAVPAQAHLTRIPIETEVKGGKETASEKDEHFGDAAVDAETLAAALLIVEEVRAVYEERCGDDDDEDIGLPQVGVDTNLHDLGLDSLTMFELHRRLERTMGRRIHRSTLIDNQSPIAIASAFASTFTGTKTRGRAIDAIHAVRAGASASVSVLDASASLSTSRDMHETIEPIKEPEGDSRTRRRKEQQGRLHERHTTSHGEDHSGMTCGCLFPFRSRR